jgi:23S rRNA (uracil1939-C5)-methyltransferase
MSTAPGPPPQPGPLRIEKPVYGGDGLARTATGEVVLIPFTLPGELIQPPPTFNILQPSPDRTEPACVHFGTCGGCQYQMAHYPAQTAIKAAILRETLERAGLTTLPEPHILPSPEPYGYRNRIRLRVREIDGTLRLGYSIRYSRDFLAIRMCPISAPILWSTAEAVLQTAATLKEAADWLRAAAELEIACDDTAQRVQLHLLCPGPIPKSKNGFQRFAEALTAIGAPVTSMGASRLHAASGRAMEPLAAWGADGIPYRVGEDSFWLKRGSFFQINRFLTPSMVQVVCQENNGTARRGALAWDLYAGVGLFTRELTRRFDRVTAVEASPIAITELRRGLRRPGDQAVEQTTLNFLRQAVLQRDRPDLVVLDPPRAGAGEEACTLLARLRPQQIVYVSCDPTTLGRDLAILTTAGYEASGLHLIDLFPQTYHLETVIALRRAA